jgi:uncharacterized membrane protein
MIMAAEIAVGGCTRRMPPPTLAFGDSPEPGIKGMGLLIAGLMLFIGVHLVPSTPKLRSTVTDAIGFNGYKAAFSLVSTVGLVLIWIGYARTPPEQIFVPSETARLVLPIGMALAFILMACAYAPGRIRRLVRHPMMASVLIWSSLHLLANGDLASNILFGTFAVWSVFAILSAMRRGQKLGDDRIRPWADPIAAAIGLIAFGIVFYSHAWLFGVPPV